MHHLDGRRPVPRHCNLFRLLAHGLLHPPAPRRVKDEVRRSLLAGRGPRGRRPRVRRARHCDRHRGQLLYGKSLDGDAANDTTTKPSLRYTQFSKFVSRTKAKKLLVRSARLPLLPGVRTRGATSVSLLGPHIHIRAR